MFKFSLLSFVVALVCTLLLPAAAQTPPAWTLLAKNSSAPPSCVWWTPPGAASEYFCGIIVKLAQFEPAPPAGFAQFQLKAARIDGQSAAVTPLPGASLLQKPDKLRCLALRAGKIDCLMLMGGTLRLIAWNGTGWDPVSTLSTLSRGNGAFDCVTWISDKTSCFTFEIDNEFGSSFPSGRGVQLMQWTWDGTAWGAPTPAGPALDGETVGEPICISGSAGELDCFVVYRGNLQTLSFRGAAWSSSWVQAASDLRSDPSCVASIVDGIRFSLPTHLTECYFGLNSATRFFRTSRSGTAAWTTPAAVDNNGMEIKDRPSCLTWGNGLDDCAIFDVAGFTPPNSARPQGAAEAWHYSKRLVRKGPINTLARWDLSWMNRPTPPVPGGGTGFWGLNAITCAKGPPKEELCVMSISDTSDPTISVVAPGAADYWSSRNQLHFLLVGGRDAQPGPVIINHPEPLPHR